MKCEMPIDPNTGIALEGEALIAALRDPTSPRCGYAIEDDDVFCPSCGARVERGQITTHKANEVCAAEERIGVGAKNHVAASAVSAEATRRFLDLCKEYQHEEAAQLLNSIDRNNAEVQFCLGEMYRYGRGVAENAAEAVKWFRKAAKQGLADAQYNLGEAYEMGWGVTENEASTAKWWYRKAAAKGNEDAQNALKRLGNRTKDHARGTVTETGFEDRKCTGHDDTSILKELGLGAAKAVGGVGQLISGLISAAITLIVGIWLYGAYCAHNDVEKHQPLGVVLQRMYGTEYNPLTRHGYRMYIKHFTTTNPDEKPTADNLGKRFESAARETVEDLGAFFDDKKNSSKNRALYRLRENLADAAGNATRGRGNVSDGIEAAVGGFLADALADAVKDDDDENQSAEQLLETSLRYFKGDGVKKDAHKAFEYCRKAAEKGNAMAQYNLGFFYETGKGVECDWNEAMKWYRKAAAKGNRTAINKLKQIDELR